MNSKKDFCKIGNFIVFFEAVPIGFQTETHA